MRHNLLFVVATYFFLILPYSSIAQQDYDIASTEFDVNGWYLNPKWTTQLKVPAYLPNPYSNSSFPVPLRSQYMWKDYTTWKCPNTAFQNVPFPGHFNFAGATFEGRVTWSDHSGDEMITISICFQTISQD